MNAAQVIQTHKKMWIMCVVVVCLFFLWVAAPLYPLQKSFGLTFDLCPFTANDSRSNRGLKLPRQLFFFPKVVFVFKHDACAAVEAEP